MYIFTCYMHTKSLHDKLTCHVACVKKIKFSVKNKAFHVTFFFYIDHKMCQFLAKLYKRS
jgi:hypothetical protein